MMRFDMRWSPTIGNAGVTARGSATGAPARSHWARIAWMVAVAGTCAVFLFGLGIGAGAGTEPARAARYSEYLVKAAILYKIAKFTEWPSGTYASAAAPFTVCVLGQDPFGKALDSIAGKRIDGRPVAISRVAQVAETGHCHLLFISESEGAQLARILRHLAGRPVLTICDKPSSTQPSSIIHLRVVSERVRFAIDTDSARSAGLKFNFRLLASAETFARKAKR